MTDEELHHVFTLVAMSQGRNTLNRVETRRAILLADGLGDRFPDDSSIERFLDAAPSSHKRPCAALQNTGPRPSHSPRQNLQSAVQPAIVIQSLRNDSYPHLEQHSSDERPARQRPDIVSSNDMEVANEEAVPVPMPRRSGRDRTPTPKARELVKLASKKAKCAPSRLKEQHGGDTKAVKLEDTQDDGSKECIGNRVKKDGNQTLPSLSQSDRARTSGYAQAQLQDTSFDSRLRLFNSELCKLSTTHNASTGGRNPQMQEASSFGGPHMPDAPSHKATVHKKRNIHNLNHPLHESASTSSHPQMLEASSYGGLLMSEARPDKLPLHRPDYSLTKNADRIISQNQQMHETSFYDGLHMPEGESDRPAMQTNRNHSKYPSDPLHTSSLHVQMQKASSHGGPLQPEAQYENSQVYCRGDFIDPNYPGHESASADRNRGRTSKEEEMLNTNARHPTQGFPIMNQQRGLELEALPYEIATQGISRDYTRMHAIEMHPPSQNMGRDAAVHPCKIRLKINPPKPPVETATGGTIAIGSNAEMHGIERSPTKREMQDFRDPQSPSPKAKMNDNPSDRKAAMARQAGIAEATNYDDVHANERRQPVEDTAHHHHKHKKDRKHKKHKHRDKRSKHDKEGK